VKPVRNVFQESFSRNPLGGRRTRNWLVHQASNGGQRGSFLHNEAVNAIILGQGFGAQMQAMFKTDLASSTPIMLEQWERRSLSDRLREALARMREYWL
jgi:hypothetical protein